MLIVDPTLLCRDDINVLFCCGDHMFRGMIYFNRSTNFYKRGLKQLFQRLLQTTFNPIKTGLLRALRCWGGPNGPSSVSFD